MSTRTTDEAIREIRKRLADHYGVRNASEFNEGYTTGLVSALFWLTGEKHDTIWARAEREASGMDSTENGTGLASEEQT